MQTLSSVMATSGFDFCIDKTTASASINLIELSLRKGVCELGSEILFSWLQIELNVLLDIEHHAEKSTFFVLYSC